MASGAAEKFVQCHPAVAPILRDRRICFISSTREQHILRCSTQQRQKRPLPGTPAALDDTSGSSFSGD
jgi:hypothetical protein